MEKAIELLHQYREQLRVARNEPIRKSKLHGLPTKEVNYHKGCADVYTGVMKDLVRIIEVLKEDSEDKQDDDPKPTSKKK